MGAQDLATHGQQKWQQLCKQFELLRHSAKPTIFRKHLSWKHVSQSIQRFVWNYSHNLFIPPKSILALSAFNIWIAPIPNDLTVAKKDARLKWFKPPRSCPNRPTITAAATRCFLSCANDFCYSRPLRIGLSSQQKVRWWLLSNKPWEHTVILSQQQHCYFLFRLFCFFCFFVSSEHKLMTKMDKMTHSELRKWLRSNLGWLILENERGEKGILFLRCLSWTNG